MTHSTCGGMEASREVAGEYLTRLLNRIPEGKKMPKECWECVLVPTRLMCLALWELLRKQVDDPQNEVVGR